MTVEELIAKLEALPGHYGVIISVTMKEAGKVNVIGVCDCKETERAIIVG